MITTPDEPGVATEIVSGSLNSVAVCTLSSTWWGVHGPTVTAGGLTISNGALTPSGIVSLAVFSDASPLST